ncbi:MAG: putative metal-binding motif-containing protein, partial [Deltaproteobacteria bacterium]|nr:putative metal-binding motif-containing protein [Deltaproteobacteria bacterium]
ADEVCDAVDHDCDGSPDNGLTYVDYYPDGDTDNFGDETADPISTCDGPPAGMVTDHTDCDDSDGNNFPTNPEVCDDADNDCSLVADDNLVFVNYYPDNDTDGFGDETVDPTSTCDGPPDGMVTDHTDCDDSDGNNFPTNPEVCDDADNDCSLVADDNLVFVDYYPDNDTDGFGDETVDPTSTCDGPPAGMVTDHTDCDDADGDNFPTNPEVCDGRDNDCSGVADDNLAFVDYYPDADGDEFGDEYGSPTSTCDGPPPGTVADNTDCDDADGDNFPTNPEVCDGRDNDCSGVADDNIAFVDYYPDADGDGFGDENGSPTSTCDGPPPGTVADHTDCDDSDASIHPLAEEIPYDGIDQDCDGLDADDMDKDGYPGGPDCDDEDPRINPGADEIADDGIDQDCSGFDLVTTLTGGEPMACGCSNAGAGPPWMLSLWMFAFVRRRGRV